MAEAFAPAKITLTLHITGQRADGYHLLDSLVVFADIGDRVTVAPAGDWSLHVTGPLAQSVPTDDSNLVLRAARLMGGPPAAITLEKHLPMASGIGGGSSDAAATLRALHALDGRAIPGDLTRLGADVPVCLAATTCRMQGIGDILKPRRDLPRLFAVLVNPGAAVATPAVYAALRAKTNPPMVKLDPAPDGNTFTRWLAEGRNDLEPPATTLAPEIAVVLSALRDTSADLSRMCGSGATCFALFPSADAARTASVTLARRFPQWWLAPCTLG